MWARNSGGGVELRFLQVRLTHKVRLTAVLCRKLTLQLWLLTAKLFGQETNSFAKEPFSTVCGEMFLIQRIQDANWIPCSVYERPDRSGVDVLRCYGGTYRYYQLKFHFTSLYCPGAYGVECCVRGLLWHSRYSVTFCINRAVGLHSKGVEHCPLSEVFLTFMTTGYSRGDAITKNFRHTKN